MFVSSPVSKSLSFLLVLGCGDARVLVDATDSARDVRPMSVAGVAERPRAGCAGGRIEDGRLMGGLFVTGGPGRGRPDIIESVTKYVPELMRW